MHASVISRRWNFYSTVDETHPCVDRLRKKCRQQSSGCPKSDEGVVLHIPANLNLAEKNLAAELDGLAAVL
jgi:hypothetical protein